ncbi:hypothetical protein I4U23_020162 [Adineta vaga]|nr:hypothetical protein I4U23_020162 [Adineta vaga]
MTTRLRLFARSREEHESRRILSSKKIIILLHDVFFDSSQLLEEFNRIPNCVYFRTDNIETFKDLVNQSDAKDALIVVIVSNRFFHFIHDHLKETVSQLSHIYLLDDILYSIDAIRNRRFHGAFNNVQSLIEKILEDIAKVRFPIRIDEGVQYVIGDNAKFFWYQVKYFLPCVPLIKTDYSHQNAIKWYTTGCFLYRLLHETPRLSKKEPLSSDKTVLTLYCGQRMKIDELRDHKKNVGKFIAKNSFLFTTSDISAAIFFAGDGALDNAEEEVSVIYQITVDTSVPHSIPFAKVKYLSVYENEDEVLFSMASVFEIENVEQYGSLWLVDLRLIDKEDETWNALTAHLNH